MFKGWLSGLGENGGPDLTEIRVEVHEEDIHEVLILDFFTSDGLEFLPSSLEGLDVEVNRLGGVMGGGVEVSEGINPGGNVGGLELGHEGTPEFRGGRVGLEEGPVLGVNPEIDGNSCLPVCLFPCILVGILLFLGPKHNPIIVLHGKQHLHFILPGEPVLSGEEGDLGEVVLEGIVGGRHAG